MTELEVFAYLMLAASLVTVLVWLTVGGFIILGIYEFAVEWKESWNRKRK